MTAHIRTCPEDDADRLRVASLLADILLDERIAQFLAVLPRRGRRQTARIESVEVASRRQDVCAVRRRRSRRPRLDVAARKGAERARQLLLRTQEARHDLLRNFAERRQKSFPAHCTVRGERFQSQRFSRRLRHVGARGEAHEKQAHDVFHRIELSAVRHAILRHAFTVLQKLFVIVALFLGDEAQERRLAAMLDAHEREHEIQEFFSFRNLP